MINTYHYNSITWVDLEAPTMDEVAEVMKKYDLHPIVAEELMSPSSKAKVESFDNYVFAVLHFPVRIRPQRVFNKVQENPNHQLPHLLHGHHHRDFVEKKEIDFVIGKNFIITTKYDSIEPLHNFSKIFETNSVIDKKGIGRHAGFVFYYMIKSLYNTYLGYLNDLETRLSNAETRIFNGDEKRMVQELSDISHQLIDIRQITKGHHEVFGQLLTPLVRSFGHDFSHYISDLQSEHQKMSEVLSSSKDLLSELRDTNDSVLSAKQNETMKIFTVLAFFTFPLSLILDIITLPTNHSLIIGHEYDFEIILVLIVGACAGMFWFFKHKKWL